MTPVKCQWTDEITPLLEIACGDDLPAIKADVDQAKSELWHFPNSGYVVTRVETDFLGYRWLVLVAGQGKNYLEIVRFWCQFADKNGLRLRAFSARPGVGRWLKSCGFEVVETVYERLP